MAVCPFQNFALVRRGKEGARQPRQGLESGPPDPDQPRLEGRKSLGRECFLQDPASLPTYDLLSAVTCPLSRLPVSFRFRLLDRKFPAFHLFLSHIFSKIPERCVPISQPLLRFNCGPVPPFEAPRQLTFTSKLLLKLQSLLQPCRQPLTTRNRLISAR